MTEHTPADPWPDHPQKYWRDALNHARARGWSLRTFKGHTWGEIRCPTDKCRVKVFSTGRGAEHVARDARKHIDRCLHDSDRRGVLDVIEDRIRKASRLVDAAEALAEGDKIQERVEILAKTEELLDNKDAVSEEFNRLVAEATRQDEAADAAFSDADEPATCQAEALDLAEQRERTIRRDLRATDRKTNRAKSLKKDCDRLRDRIAALRRT